MCRCEGEIRSEFFPPLADQPACLLFLPRPLLLRYFETGVEHSCYQCAAQVEDGIPFCPKCGAPQIRVAVPEAIAVASAPVHEESPISASLSPDTRLDWSQALPAVAWAVVLAGLVTLLTFGSLGIGMLVAGAISVVFYRRRRAGLNISAGAGARLGALTGTLASALILVALGVAAFVFHKGAGIHAFLLSALEQYAARHPSPQSQQVIDLFNSPEGFAFGLICTFLVCVAFSSAGGALGAVVFRRRSRL